MPAFTLDLTQEPRETVSCNFCQSDRSEPLFVVNGFQIVRCRDCALVYTNPRLRPDRLKNVYDNSYFQSDDSLVHGYQDYESEREAILLTFSERWKIIRRFSNVAAGRMLDVGCAFGFLLEVAKRDGWQVAGLDMSDFAVAHAREKSGLPVRVSDLSTLDFPDEHFDVVTMWDVVEHLPDPTKTLSECRRVLKPGGIFSVITPDQSSLSARVFGPKWVEYQKPHEHLFFFTRKHLTARLESMGFAREWAGTAGKYVPLGFALDRLTAYQKSTFSVLGKVARSAGIDSWKLKVNPFDKMSLIFRKVGR